MRRVDQYQKKRQKRNQWRKLISCLTAIVVFSATYVMVSPAATMESVCQIPEHTHSEACYTQVEAEPRRVPICTEASLNIHRHTSACKNSDGARVCGYADFVVHQHDESCYDGDNNRWCALPVTRPHTHGDSCYTPAGCIRRSPAHGCLLCLGARRSDLRRGRKRGTHP